MGLTSFHPPQRILMGPGPSEIHPRVLRALSRPTVGHLDPEFIRMMDEVKELLKRTLLTRNEMTFVVSGPGSAGMEMALVNTVEPEDAVVVCVNGVFGARMKAIVERLGARVVVVEAPWGRAIDPHRLEDALKAHPEAGVVAFVHAETSTGALSDAAALAAVAHQHDCLVIVDAVTSLGGCPLKVDEWKLDVVYSGSQKCLSAPPGLSPITFNDRALERLRRRKSPIPSWFMDVNLIMQYWGGDQRRAYHHTAPIHNLYGLHEALVLLQEEGLENAWRRHWENHRRLREALQAMGLQWWVPEAERIPQLNAVRIPAGIDDARVRRRLLDEYDLEIGAGLGPMAGKIWRIGLMGYSSRRKNVLYCSSALAAVLREEGYSP